MHNPAGLSPIVAGAWRLAEWGWTAQQRLAWIEGNLDIGVTSFDHADIYGGYTVESMFGDALVLRASKAYENRRPIVRPEMSSMA